MAGPHGLLEVACWLPLEGFVGKAGAQGHGDAGAKEGPFARTRFAVDSGRRRSSRTPRFPV